MTNPELQVEEEETDDDEDDEEDAKERERRKHRENYNRIMAVRFCVFVSVCVMLSSCRVQSAIIRREYSRLCV